MTSNKKLSSLWLGLLLYTYAILLWGTFVRASRSGSGCGSSWPACEGSLLFDISNIAQIIEYVHRLTSGMYGLFALALVVYSIRSKGFRALGWLCLGFLFLVFVEAWIGRMLVVKELVVDDQRIARLIWMGFHFLNTLLLVSSVVLIYVQCKAPAKAATHYMRKLGKYVLTSPLTLGFLLVSVLGIVAAFYDTTVIKGGQAATGVPEVIALLRNVHPFVALAYVFFVVYQFIAAKTHTAKQNKLLVVLVGNVLLGGLNIFFHHVTFLQVSHVLIAHMIWLVLVLIGLQEDG